MLVSSLGDDFVHTVEGWGTLVPASATFVVAYPAMRTARATTRLAGEKWVSFEATTILGSGEQG